MCSCECVWLPVLLSVNIIYFFINGEKNEAVKKTTCKKKLSQRDLKNHHWYGMASHCRVLFRGFCRTDWLLNGQLARLLCRGGSWAYHTAKTVRTCPVFCLKCCNLSLSCPEKGWKEAGLCEWDPAYRYLFYRDRSYHLKYCIRVFCQCNHRLLRFYGRHT